MLQVSVIVNGSPEGDHGRRQVEEGKEKRVWERTSSIGEGKRQDKACDDYMENTV